MISGWEERSLITWPRYLLEMSVTHEFEQSRVKTYLSRCQYQGLSGKCVSAVTTVKEFERCIPTNRGFVANGSKDELVVEQDSQVVVAGGVNGQPGFNHDMSWGGKYT